MENKKPSKLEKIEKFYVVPCGPMEIEADSVCRRSLSQGMDKLLDRLTQEVNPEIPPSAKLPKGTVADETGKLVVEKSESREDKKQRLIEEGKLRAEVRLAIKQYQEGLNPGDLRQDNLQGNSKLLQDITGRIHPHLNT